MSKKYFVFLSCTTEDLKTERQELIRMIYGLGAVPITMDAFDIADEEDQKIIEKVIGQCDYFVNITAFKGGEACGKSFRLEAEYEFAARAGVPVIALLIGEKARWKDSKKEKSPAAAKALISFKKKLETHTSDTWTTSNDLKQKALFLLNREMNTNPRDGWVPSIAAVEPLVANELARLSRENEILRKRISLGGVEVSKKIRAQIMEALKVLSTNRVSLSFYYTTGENWENTVSFRYLKLFKLLVPELSTPKTAADISRFLGNVLNPDLEKTIRKDFPTPSNTIKKIIADFMLLRLAKYAETAPLDAAADYEAWELSEFGNEVYTVYRIRQMTSKNPPQNGQHKPPEAENHTKSADMV